MSPDIQSRSTSEFEGKSKPLCELCYSVTDCHHSTPVWTIQGKRVIRNFNIKNGKLNSDESYYTNGECYIERTSRSKPEPGDLIITREAPMGEVCVIPEGVECCLGQRLVLIKPDPEKIDSRYLLYALLSEFVQKQIFQSDKTGSIVSNLRIPLLKGIQIPIVRNPSGVAAVLSALDAKIECNNRINAELEAMAKTLYDYWFVQFDFPDENGKPYKSSGGRMVYNPTLQREIPSGWTSGIAADLLIFNPSISLKKNLEAPYLDMNALPLAGFMTDLPDHKPFKGGAKFQNGDVVLARITPCLENGKTGLITLLQGDEVGFGSTEFIVLRGRKNSLPGFASQLSRSASFRQYAIANMTGTSGRKRIDAKTLETYSLPLPQESILLKYEQLVASFYEQLTNNTWENSHLAHLRDWLLPMLMNGQVMVAEGEAES